MTDRMVWAALLVLTLCLALGCVTRVMGGTRTTEPGGDEAKSELVKGLEVEVAWGQSGTGTGLHGGVISIPFAGMVGPLLRQALSLVPGVSGPAPTVIVQPAVAAPTTPAPESVPGPAGEPAP